MIKKTKSNTYTEWEELPLVINIRQMADILGINPATAHVLVKSKGFPVVQMGKRYKIYRENLRNWLERYCSE